MFSFKVMDREGSGFIDKSEIVQVLRVLNETCSFYGDKSLEMSLIYDLVDSLYTSSGRIDGSICYLNIAEFIANHPITELALSPQFQGPARSKLLSEEDIDAIVGAASN
jgi:hypothetical protein